MPLATPDMNRLQALVETNGEYAKALTLMRQTQTLTTYNQTSHLQTETCLQNESTRN